MVQLGTSGSIATNSMLYAINQIMTNTISITYTLKWRLKTDTNYQWSECGKLFNVCRGRLKKKVVNGGVAGYWIGRKFIPLSKLRSQLELIPKENLPF